MLSPNKVCLIFHVLNFIQARLKNAKNVWFIVLLLLLLQTTITKKLSTVTLSTPHASSMQWFGIFNWISEMIQPIMYPNYIPQIRPLTKWLKGMIRAHTTPATDHPGIHHIYVLLKDNYWWPKMLSDIHWYISSCTTCTQARVPHSSLSIHGLISIDFYDYLPGSLGSWLLWTNSQSPSTFSQQTLQLQS